jgi:hypothetical protein
LKAARELLHVPRAPPAIAGTAEPDSAPLDTAPPTFVCSHCGHAMLIVQTFAHGGAIRAPPS